MTLSELVTAIAMGITAGAPAGAVLLRHLSRVTETMVKGVDALTRIADRLDGADYIKLAPSRRSVDSDSQGVA